MVTGPLNRCCFTFTFLYEAGLLRFTRGKPCGYIALEDIPIARPVPLRSWKLRRTPLRVLRSLAVANGGPLRTCRLVEVGN